MDFGMAWGRLRQSRMNYLLWCVVNDAHLALAKYMVDLHFAIEMQDNPGIQRNIGAAHRSLDHGVASVTTSTMALCQTHATTKTSESSSKTSEDKGSEVVVFLWKAAVNLNDPR